MKEFSEVTLTKEYIINNMEFYDGRYQTIICWDDIYNHHYLLSIFSNMIDYLRWNAPLEVEGNHCISNVITDIVQELECGQLKLTIFLNKIFVDSCD